MPQGWKYDTQEKLRDAGYSFQETGKCLAPSCKTIIHWFITPKGKWMPFELFSPTGEVGDHDRDQPFSYRPHFATCPESRKFSRKSKDYVTTRG